MAWILAERINVAMISELARPFVQHSFNLPSLSTDCIRQVFSRSHSCLFLSKNIIVHFNDSLSNTINYFACQSPSRCIIDVKIVSVTWVSLHQLSEPLQQHLLPSAFEWVHMILNEKDLGVRPKKLKSWLPLFANYVILALVCADPQFTHLQWWE